jgi:hypothetical protein
MDEDSWKVLVVSPRKTFDLMIGAKLKINPKSCMDVEIPSHFTISAVILPFIYPPHMSHLSRKSIASIDQTLAAGIVLKGADLDLSWGGAWTILIG